MFTAALAQYVSSFMLNVLSIFFMVNVSSAFCNGGY